MNFLALFPDLQNELDLAFEEATGRITRSGFQRSKEKVIIVEVFFDKKPDLAENDRRELVALVKEIGGSKELKARLKNWESPSTGLLSSLLSGFTSFFSLKEWTSGSIKEAVCQSKDTLDWVFLAALQEKVLKEPLLEQLAQDAVMEAHAHLHDFIKQRLPRFYSRAAGIRWRTVFHQVEAEVNDQDQKRRASSRSDWFDGIKKAQAQVNLGYVLYYPQVLTLLICTVDPRIWYSFIMLRR